MLREHPSDTPLDYRQAPHAVEQVSDCNVELETTDHRLIHVTTFPCLRFCKRCYRQRRIAQPPRLVRLPILGHGLDADHLQQSARIIANPKATYHAVPRH